MTPIDQQIEQIEALAARHFPDSEAERLGHLLSEGVAVTVSDDEGLEAEGILEQNRLLDRWEVRFDRRTLRRTNP